MDYRDSINHPTGRRQQHQQQLSAERGEWLKLSDAAYSLGVSEITLRRRIKSGRLQSELRNGKYQVYLEIDPSSGEYLEPSHTPSEEPNPTGRFTALQKKISTLPRQESAFVTNPLDNPSTAQASLIQRQMNQVLKKLETQSLEIAELRRQLEDQQTLISLLEEQISL